MNINYCAAICISAVFGGMIAHYGLPSLGDHPPEFTVTSAMASVVIIVVNLILGAISK